MKLWIVSVFWVLLLIQKSFAGVEPVAPGKLFVQNTVKYLQTETYYNKKGDEQSIVPTQNISAKLYGEVGVWHRFALIFNVDYYQALSTDSRVVVHELARVVEEETKGGTTSGLGSSEVGFKFRLYKRNKLTLGLESLVGIPGTSFQNTTAAPDLEGVDRTQYSGYDFRTKDTPEFSIPIGYNDWQGTLFLRAGTHLKGVEVSGGLGYQARSKGNDDGLMLQANAGFVPIPRLYWNFGVYGYTVLGDIDTEYEYQTLSISTSGYYGLTSNLGIIAGLETAFLNKNTLAALVPSLGFYLSF